jgi:hypothetical protein
VYVPARALLTVLAALALSGCGGGDDQGSPATTRVPTTSTPSVATVSCTEGTYQAKNPRRYVHPSKYFYAVGDKDAPSALDLDHLVINDNAVIVRYRPDASAADRRALEKWGPFVLALVIVPNDAGHAPPIEAYTRYRRLACDGVDVKQLGAFANGARGGGIATHPGD